MKTKLKLHLLFLVLLSLPALARAQGTAFSYQGHMLEKGVAANGGHDFIFALFNAAAAGGQIGPALPLNNTPVMNGQFNVTLDFGANVFTGDPRWLEISIRPAGVGQFTKMDARASLLPTPYAIFATTAGSVANGAVTANQLNTGGLAPTPGQFLAYNGGNLVWSDPGVAVGNVWSLHGLDAYYNSGNVGIGGLAGTSKLQITGADALTLSGAGPYLSWHDTTTGRNAAISSAGGTLYYRVPDAVGNVLTAGYVDSNGMVTRGRLSVEGNVGIGAAPLLGERLTVGGASIADTKIEINAGGDNYAALRLKNSNASWLWQVTPSNDAPGGRLRLTDETTGNEWLSINHSGNVGIGTTAPAHRLSLIGGPLWTAYSWTGALELGNASAIGWQANAGGQRFGIGQSTGGLYFFRTASDPGTTGSTANYDLEITDSGNLSQARDKGGAVKAMVFVGADGSIKRSYNSQSANITVNVVRSGEYEIDFGFQVDDRFVSVTTGPSGIARAGANVYYQGRAGAPNTSLIVATFVTTDGGDAPADFTIIVY